jgi:ribonuclease J
MALNFHEYEKELLFIPLGGLNEIGMNLALYTIEDKWLMVDCGIGFADDYLPGIDVVVPDIEFLLDKKDKLLGLVLTHAHEDHIGAIPYLWSEFACTMYATPFTASLVKRKLAEEGLSNKAKVVEIAPGGKQVLGPFEIEMIPITHSIPEMQGLAIRTSQGVVMHTGDWKLDPDPLVGPVTDEVTLRRYGDEGVLAMVCDSTNVFVEGTSGSEAMVRENLIKVIKSCENRIAVTTFASNIARIETIIRAAEASGRHVALAGRSLWRVIEAAKEAGYLPDTKPFLTDKDAMKLNKADCLIICTGCQGEPLAALSKLARGEHPQLRLSPADTVIFSSRKIPGNEMRIGRMINQFIENGIEVITDNDADIHVSGHPARDELTRMYELIRPQISLPVHGERRHLHEHARLARSLGVPQAIEGGNGSVILLSKEKSGVIGRVHSGYMAVDGTSLIPTDSVVIKTRRKLRDDGIIIASLAVDEDGGLSSDIKIAAPGCLDPEADHELVDALKEAIEEALEKTPTPDTSKLTESVRLTLRKMIKNELGKKPVIEVQLLRV